VESWSGREDSPLSGGGAVLGHASVSYVVGRAVTLRCLPPPVYTNGSPTCTVDITAHRLPRPHRPTFTG
jgi:hypothetical protein